MPLPDSPGFVGEGSKIIEELLEYSRGRAFLLFTSKKNLEAFYGKLSRRIKYPVLRQGNRPRSELLREFREVEESVLFATMSFWQGVDVVGPALSLVVIDRLPFDSPGDPLTKARINAINAKGGNAFLEYQVPGAVIMLRQGLGRLIRSRKDSGVLCILDPRISKKSLRQNLPRKPAGDSDHAHPQGGRRTFSPGTGSDQRGATGTPTGRRGRDRARAGPSLRTEFPLGDGPDQRGPVRQRRGL